MNDLIQKLLDHLGLEQLEDNLFRGDSRDIGGKSVFGGQVLGQAFVAANRTVEGRRAHSLHAYFLRPGNPQAPIVYDVERIRDGGSFTTRRVVAIQHGLAILNMAISFQLSEEGFEHQMAMPEVPQPETLASIDELRRRLGDHLPERKRALLTCERPIEIRPVHPLDPINPKPMPPCQQVWMRAAGTLPDDPVMHQAVLAYASDFTLLATAFLPHGISFFQPNILAASLDHAMWFHQPFRADEWLLYAMDSPSAFGGRGLGRGNIFTRDGRLIASVIQEGVIRTCRDEEAG